MRNFTNIFEEFVAIKEQMCDALKVAGPVQYRNIMVSGSEEQQFWQSQALHTSPYILSPHTVNFQTIMVIASLFILE